MSVPLQQLITAGAVGGTRFRKPPFFRTKKVGILGSTESLKFAPWTDPSWTFVAHPCCRPQCGREPDWYVDMHRVECWRVEKKSWHDNYYTWLRSLQTPIFMQEYYKDVPMSVRYPIERITSEFRPYFTNHVAYMIALAMTEGVTHIGLFGCQYSADTEHSVQRDSMTYWLGRFEQAGGTLVIPQKFNSVLSAPKLLYGYESHDEHGKLVDAYRPRVVKEKVKDASLRERLAAQAPIKRRAKKDVRVPLMAPPEGVEIAWERSGYAHPH